MKSFHSAATSACSSAVEAPENALGRREIEKSVAGMRVASIRSVGFAGSPANRSPFPPNSMNQLRSQRAAAGFTLVELMVTFSLIAILVGITGSYFRSPRNERAVVGATHAITSMFAELRNRAMSTGNAVIVRVEANVGYPDIVTGESLGSGGTRASRLQVYDSTSASCRDAKATMLFNDPEGIVLNALEPELPYRTAVIARVEPSTNLGVSVICFTPSGRVVDPSTSRPITAVGNSVFGGRLLLEIRSAVCDGPECAYAPERATLALGFNGLVQVLPDTFDMENL